MRSLKQKNRPDRILVCTHNTHKLEEITAMLASLDIEVISPRDIPDLPEPEETGATFDENALLKVDSAFAHTGLPCLADDSGLVVPALDGAPGIYSARYAGHSGENRDHANRQKLIAALQSHSPEDRKAHFHCSLILRTDAEHYEVFVGTCHGQIILEERGEHGFGYDPIFYLPHLNKTLAQLPPDEKNRISHRAHAIAKLCDWLDT